MDVSPNDSHQHTYKSLLKSILDHLISLEILFQLSKISSKPQEMDRQGGFIVPKCDRFIKKTLQFLVVVSFSLFLYSYFSGFPFFFFFSYNLQLSSLIFPLCARALDRKYMFLVCNGIVVFLAKTGILKSAEDDVEQITEIPAVTKEETVRQNAESMIYAINSTRVAVSEDEQTMQQHSVQDYGDIDKGAEETKIMEVTLLESEEFEEEEEEEEGDEYLEENKTIDSLSEVSEASVSTEELNRKIEEFIRKMKEEIRIEAQQQLITV